MQRAGLILGLLLFFVTALFDFEPGNPAGTRMAAVALLMATWWITEAIPLFATALLPLVLFPLLGIERGGVTAPIYFNSTIVLFLGGFMIALTMEKWNLHRRISAYDHQGHRRRTRTHRAGLHGGGLLAVHVDLQHRHRDHDGADRARHRARDGEGLRNRGHPSLLGRGHVGHRLRLHGRRDRDPRRHSTPTCRSCGSSRSPFRMRRAITFGQWIFMALPISLVMLGMAWLLITKVFFRVPEHVTVDREVVERPGRGVGAGELRGEGGAHGLRAHGSSLGVSTPDSAWIHQHPRVGPAPALPRAHRRRHRGDRDGVAPLPDPEPHARRIVPHPRGQGRHSTAAVEHRAALRGRLRPRPRISGHGPLVASRQPVRRACGGPALRGDRDALPRAHVPDRADLQHGHDGDDPSHSGVGGGSPRTSIR